MEFGTVLSMGKLSRLFPGEECVAYKLGGGGEANQFIGTVLIARRESMALARTSSPLALVACFARVAARFLRAWREDPGKVTLVLGLATTSVVASGWADGRPPTSKVALGGAFVGGVTTTVASFWLAHDGVAPRRRRTSYFILVVVGTACLLVAVALCEFDTEFFMDICSAIL